MHPQDLLERSMRGDLQLRLQGVRGLMEALDLRVDRPDGSEILTGKIPVAAGQDSVSSTLVLPAGLGYTLTLTGETVDGARCIGTAVFNVGARQGNEVRVTLTCEDHSQGGANNNGSVNVEVDIDTGKAGECPDISFISALPRKMNAGGTVKLRSAATHGRAQFRWRASSGSFSYPQSADTDYLCTEVGPATVALTVSLGSSCEESFELVVDCLAVAGDGDSGTGGSDSGGVTEKEVRRIRFQPTVAGEEFACGRSYSGLGQTGADGSVSDFRFYVHDLVLLTAEGLEVPFEIEERAPWQGSGVALVDFEGGPDAGCYGGTSGSNVELTGLAPKGVYTGVRFSIGVPKTLSHADPSTLKAPLTAGGMAWSWLAGFKFLKFELGTGLLHVGSTGCTSNSANEINCRLENRPEIELRNFDPHTQVIKTDIAAAFRSSDLGQNPSCHSTGEACTALFQELGLKLEDGTTQDTQSVFSVE